MTPPPPARDPDAPRAAAAEEDVELQVALLLRRADRSSRSPLLAGTLDRSAYLALDLLEREGPCGVSELAEHLRLDASTVTRQVVAMQDAGHVTRERDARDGRRAVVATTRAGLDALHATRRARRALYDQVLTAWEPRDRAELVRLLARLNDDLDAHVRRAGG